MSSASQPVVTADLAFKDGGSDKVYHVQLVPSGTGYVVNFQYGRRGNSLQSGTKTNKPVTLEAAQKIFDKLVQEKSSKGYSQGAQGTPYVGSENAGKISGFVPQLLNFVKDDEELEDLLNDPMWMMQEKHDGVNYSLRKKGDVIEGINRRGLVVDVPETILAAAKAIPEDFLICGERIGDTLHVFDLIEYAGKDWRELSARFRWLGLSCPAFEGHSLKIVKTHLETAEKRKVFNAGKKNGVEGFVFKRVDAKFVSGRPASGGNMRKYKFYASGTFEVVAVGNKRSVTVGCVGEPENCDNLGNVTIPVNYEMPEKGDYIEVEYLYAYPDGGSLFQSIYRGKRTDKVEADHYTSLKFKSSTDDDV